MGKPIVFMFPGQGSQYYHMGKELYKNHARFKLWMDYCNEIVRPLIHTSLIDVLYSDQNQKYQPFDRILYTNPALICIEYSLARILMEMNVRPDFVLGYSLGEITAAIISGVLSLEEGLQFAVDTAKLIEKETPSARMLAILESADRMTQFPDLFQYCWLIGNNCPKHFVVSSLAEHIPIIQEGLNQKKWLFQKLPVNYGFHTKLMDTVEEEFRQLVRKINLSPIRIPIISSLKSKKIEEPSETYFWEIFRFPVAFKRTIGSMLQKDDYIFIDTGPSGSLATFVKYLLPSNSNSLHFELMNQYGMNLNAIEKLSLALPAV